jgi:hypothetical protein
MFAVMLILSVGGVAVANVIAARQVHKLCATIVAIDDGYHTPPGPQTATGRQLMQNMDKLRQSLGC